MFPDKNVELERTLHDYRAKVAALEKQAATATIADEKAEWTIAALEKELAERRKDTVSWITAFEKAKLDIGSLKAELARFELLAADQGRELEKLRAVAKAAKTVRFYYRGFKHCEPLWLALDALDLHPGVTHEGT